MFCEDAKPQYWPPTTCYKLRFETMWPGERRWKSLLEAPNSIPFRWHYPQDYSISSSYNVILSVDPTLECRGGGVSGRIPSRRLRLP